MGRERRRRHPGGAGHGSRHAARCDHDRRRLQHAAAVPGHPRRLLPDRLQRDAHRAERFDLDAQLVLVGGLRRDDHVPQRVHAAGSPAGLVIPSQSKTWRPSRAVNKKEKHHADPPHDHRHHRALPDDAQGRLDARDDGRQHGNRRHCYRPSRASPTTTPASSRPTSRRRSRKRSTSPASS